MTHINKHGIRKNNISSSFLTILLLGTLIFFCNLNILLFAYPGDSYLHPTIHFAPTYVSDQGGWHDVAGAITHGKIHHVFQGTGWNHATSNDLVHWKTAPHGPIAIHETYDGMDSLSTPCSGFVTKDDEGFICAGFRQCGSKKGVAGSADWDVPLELRCATDQSANLSSFSSDPSSPYYSYLFNVSFWRAIPYDPARPWFEESTGQWYQLLSMDACNVSGGNVGGKTCSKGGQLNMWSSPALRGDLANWKLVGPVWTDNTTVLRDGFLSHEFVTIDFLGSMSSSEITISNRTTTTTIGNNNNNNYDDVADDEESNTFYFLNNVGGNGGGDGCCSGTTAYTVLKQPNGPGTAFEKYGPGQLMLDWGSFTLKSPLPTTYQDSLDLLTGTASRGLSMARTLGGEEADQVTKPGRRVLIGWTGPAPKETFNNANGGSAQSLPRDLFVDPKTSKIVQQFVPELQSLRSTRIPSAQISTTAKNVPMGINPIEIIALFPTECINSVQCGIEVLASSNTFGDGESLRITFDSKLGLVLVNGTTMHNNAVRAAPIPTPLVTNDNENDTDAFKLHAIVDHSMVELIINGDVAFVIYVAPSSKDTLGNVRTFGSDGISVDIWKLNDANV